ncbi:Probable gamma-glutamyltranspeptidase [Oceanicola granulosus HTCC2516]|uniref:Glutathione hydrolase proenzyme n=2 Tax=Oceanicola granulosus TaxID=252302 RepID=Q2CAH2_OCEGH|nr:Probable gamma-glutamyltranspeptidase [Oceanicola granulosus HTCC2516]
MCATSHPLAAKVAVQMLEAGGNALDAAIAGGVLLNICEPMMTGLAGDCFALVSEPGQPVVAVNGSGRAPQGLDAEALRAKGPTMPVYDVDAVTVPGAIDAFCKMSERWGRMSLGDVLAPAVYYAEAGVPVGPRSAHDWARATHLKGAAQRFFTNDGKPLGIGDVFTALGQAEVLRQIAVDGRAAFYEGEIAEDMVQSLQALGGSHTMADFAAVETEFSSPVTGRYGGHELLEHPPNGQGAAAILLLNILSHFDLPGLDPLGAERAHLEAEATKLAYDARNRFIADPDQTARLEHMLAPETAAGLAKLIRKDAVLPQSPPGAEEVHRDTVYITVVDGAGMAVSLIYSIFHAFGSGLASDKFGLLFQNRGAGFTLEPGHPNEAGPGKRPMHTIIPGMLAREGRVMMPFGVMGGQYQCTGHARLVSNLLDYGMDVQAAIDAPRLFAENGRLTLERGFAPEVAQALSELGHDVVMAETPLGGAQAIRMHEGRVLEGGSDPRKDGCALGY